MVWGHKAVYGYFVLGLKGPIGGGIRIGALVIEDVTELFFWDF